GRFGAGRRSTTTFLFSGGTRPQLCRLRDNATVAFLSQPAERQFEAAEIERRIFFRALSFMQNHDRARLASLDNSFHYFRWIATDSVEPAHRPADQLQPTPIQFRMDEQIFQTGG